MARSRRKVLTNRVHEAAVLLPAIAGGARRLGQRVPRLPAVTRSGPLREFIARYQLKQLLVGN